MRLTSRLGRATVAFTLPLVLLLGACGSDTATDEKSSDSSPSAAASDSETTSEDLQEGDTVDPADFSDMVQAGLDDTRTAHVVMNTSSAGQEMKADGDIDYTDAKDVKMAMTMDVAGQKMELILVNRKMYMKMAGLTGDKYAVVDLQAQDNKKLSEQLDLRRSMETFQDSAKKITYLGTENIGGEDCGKYEVVVDGTKLADTAGEGANLPNEITYNVWLDGSNRMKKTEYSTGDVAMTMEVTAINKPVQIEVPPSSEVTQMPGM